MVAFLAGFITGTILQLTFKKLITDYRYPSKRSRIDSEARSMLSGYSGTA